jgi:hypothetical protein
VDHRDAHVAPVVQELGAKGLRETFDGVFGWVHIHPGRDLIVPLQWTACMS